MSVIKVALDWTPNPLHAGLFVAQAKGFYKKVGLDVNLISPSSDNYETTPGKKLSSGKVDFCLCPSESVISFQTTTPSVPIKACAALLHKDASAIISRKATRPSELVKAGTYASYGARYEDAIVQAMIDRDAGGKGIAGQLKTTTPAKLGIWQTVVKGECDSTWIFGPFEGVQAKRAGHNFHTFQLGDYNIPYGYSPLIAFNETTLKSESSDGGKESSYKAFLKATGEGYAYASNPENINETALVLQKVMREHGLSERDTDLEFLKESQETLNGYYNFEGTSKFGVMKQIVWDQFVEFLSQLDLLKQKDGADSTVWPTQFYTNSLLDE